MDPDADAIFGAADIAAGVETPEPKQTTAEEPKSVPEPETKPAAKEVEKPGFTDETPAPAAEPSKSSQEPKTETKTEADKPVENDWRAMLPPAPVVPKIEKTPELDDNNNIVNMTPQEYEDYLVTKAEHRMAERSYAQLVENAALDQVEKILPEIKENPTIRQLVENQRVADVVAGKQGDIVEAAKALRTLLDGKKAEGAQNTKVSIETQELAAVETGNTQTQHTNAKGEDIARRINAGDDDAFVELLDIWQDQGYV